MRMNFDVNEDGLIVVAGDRRRGVWSNNSLLRHQRSIRTAGSLATVASAHTLQVVALTNALQSISKRDAAKLVDDTGRKPTIIVGSQDRSFLAAIDALVQNTPGKPLRAGKNFLDILHKQLNRFNIVTRSPEDSDKSILVFAAWANNQIAAPKIVAEIPAVLAPTVITRYVP